MWLFENGKARSLMGKRKKHPQSSEVPIWECEEQVSQPGVLGRVYPQCTIGPEVQRESWGLWVLHGLHHYAPKCWPGSGRPGAWHWGPQQTASTAHHSAWPGAWGWALLLKTLLKALAWPWNPHFHVLLAPRWQISCLRDQRRGAMSFHWTIWGMLCYFLCWLLCRGENPDEVHMKNKSV